MILCSPVSRLDEIPKILQVTHSFIDFYNVNGEPLKKEVKFYDFKMRMMEHWETYCSGKSEMVVNASDGFLHISLDGICGKGTCEAR